MRVRCSKWSPLSRVQPWRDCWHPGRVFSMCSYVLVLPPSPSTLQKSICWQKKTKPVPQSGAYSRHAILPWRIPSPQTAQVRNEVHTCLPAHDWNVCLVSFIRHILCLLSIPHHSCLHLRARCRLGFQHPSVIWRGGEGRKEKEKRNSCGEWAKLPTLSRMSLKSSTIWLTSERPDPEVIEPLFAFESER